MEIINKFDNALAGVAGDNGSTGAVVNNGNKIETGKYWQMQTCKGHARGRQRPASSRRSFDAQHTTRSSATGFRQLLPSGTAPVYPAGAALQPARADRRWASTRSAG